MSTSTKSSLKYVQLLCVLVAPLLVLGPFLPDVIISLLSIWFIYFIIKNKYYYIFKNNYFFYFLLFWIACIVSSLFSENILLSLKSSFFYIRIGIFSLLISYLIDQDKKILNYFYYVLLFLFSLLTLDGYLQFITGKNLIGLKIYQGYRVTSFFGDEQILGSFLARLFPLLFALFVIRKKNYYEIIFMSFLFLSIDILVFLAGERAAFALLNLSTIFIILFISKYKLLRFGIFILSLVIISFFLNNNSKLYERYILSPLEGISTYKLNSSNKIIFSQNHDSMIRTAYNMFKDRPLIGHGPKTFRIQCQKEKYAVGIHPCSTHPHNFYVQLLAETGLIGFSFLFGVLIYFVYLVFLHIKIYFLKKKLFLSDYQICLLSGLLITIWPLTTNGNFFTNYLMLIYTLQIGFFKKIYKVI